MSDEVAEMTAEKATEETVEEKVEENVEETVEETAEETAESTTEVAAENEDENEMNVDDAEQALSVEDSKQEFPEIFICLDDDDSDYEEVNVINVDGERSKNDDILEFMDSLRLKGPPDSLELDILKLPNLQTITSETKEVRDNRSLIVAPVGIADLSEPVFQQVLTRDATINFSLNFSREDDGLKNWTGSATFSFKSTSATNLAKGELSELREDMHIYQGPEAEAKMLKALQQSKKPADDSWIDKILLVKNIGDSVNTSKLKELFPDADIVVHKDAAAEKLKGQAYLLYDTKERTDTVLKESNGKRLELNGRRLLVFRCCRTQGRIIPDDMLRLGERLMVFDNLKQTKSQIDKFGKSDWLTNKVSWLEDLIKKDDKVRTEIGLTSPSHEHLSKMKNIRKFNDAEMTQTLAKLLAPYKKQKQEETKQKNLLDAKKSEIEKSGSRSTAPNKRVDAKDAKAKFEKSPMQKGKFDKFGTSSDGKKSTILPPKPRECQFCGEWCKSWKQWKFHMQNVHEQYGNSEWQTGKETSYTGERPNKASSSKFITGSSKFGSSSRKRPFSLLGAPVPSVKRSSGNGLLGARPQAAARPLAAARSGRNALPPSLLSLNDIHPTGNIAAGPGLMGSPPSLLATGGYPSLLPVRDNRDMNIEPFRKVQHMSNMEIEDQRDRYDDQEMRQRSSGYGADRFGMDSHPAAYDLDIRYRMPDMRRDERNMDQIYQKKMSAGGDGSGVKSLFGSRSVVFDRNSSGMREEQDFRRPISAATFHSNDDGRKNWRNKKDIVPRVDVRNVRDNRRDQMERATAKSDPVSLLLNLSQLLAEKMQRDRDRP